MVFVHERVDGLKNPGSLDPDELGGLARVITFENSAVNQLQLTRPLLLKSISLFSQQTMPKVLLGAPTVIPLSIVETSKVTQWDFGIV
jgi:hypothetical protein